jgi:putative chitinase
MGTLKKENLVGVIPAAVYDKIDEIIAMGINTIPRMAHFLAQAAHESGDFTLKKENMNYSSKGLLGTFPKYFKGNLAEAYARKPELIGSRVYANRMGNGDESSKEGFKYCGRGYIQLTGKENYKKFGTSIGVDLVANPELVATTYALESACWFFKVNGILEVCDKGVGHDIVELVTKRVNGGTIGLSDRIAHFDKYIAALNKK